MRFRVLISLYGAIDVKDCKYTPGHGFDPRWGSRIIAEGKMLEFGICWVKARDLLAALHDYYNPMEMQAYYNNNTMLLAPVITRRSSQYISQMLANQYYNTSTDFLCDLTLLYSDEEPLVQGSATEDEDYMWYLPKTLKVKQKVIDAYRGKQLMTFPNLPAAPDSLVKELGTRLAYAEWTRDMLVYYQL